MKERLPLFPAVLLCAVLALCFIPACNSLAGKFPRAGKAAAGNSTAIKTPVFESLPPLSPATVYAWKDQIFVLLEKGTGFSKFGYELYSCPGLDTCRDTIADTAKWTKSHRAKCTVFKGHRLKVVSVDPCGKEWLLVFHDEQTKDTLYARTRNGIYHEIARESDLAGAVRRWKGKVVFSAHGFINTIEKGKTGTIKVRLQDPLQVQDVCFGVTPFPVKPLRLMVLTTFGKKGFIPVYYSKTNVNEDLILGQNPWEEDIFETNPQKMFLANDETWRVINDHRIYTGMTDDQVRLSWGLPQSRTTATYKGKTCECWAYAGQSLYFHENKLIGSSAGVKRKGKTEK